MKVEWSPLAKSNYWKNIEYLEEHWTANDVISFIKEVDSTINLLQKNNVHFIQTKYKNVCKVIITKHISLFYRINNQKIELLRFWNNYQDLTKFKLK